MGVVEFFVCVARECRVVELAVAKDAMFEALGLEEDLKASALIELEDDVYEEVVFAYKDTGHGQC